MICQAQQQAGQAGVGWPKHWIRISPVFVGFCDRVMRKLLPFEQFMRLRKFVEGVVCKIGVCNEIKIIQNAEQEDKADNVNVWDGRRGSERLPARIFPCCTTRPSLTTDSAKNQIFCSELRRTKYFAKFCSPHCLVAVKSCLLNTCRNECNFWLVVLVLI